MQTRANAENFVYSGRFCNQEVRDEKYRIDRQKNSLKASLIQNQKSEKQRFQIGRQESKSKNESKVKTMNQKSG